MELEKITSIAIEVADEYIPSVDKLVTLMYSRLIEIAKENGIDVLCPNGEPCFTPEWLALDGFVYSLLADAINGSRALVTVLGDPSVVNGLTATLNTNNSGVKFQA